MNLAKCDFFSQMGIEGGVPMMWSWLCGHSILPRSFNQSCSTTKAAAAAAVSQRNTGERKEYIITKRMIIPAIVTVREVKAVLHKRQKEENNDYVFIIQLMFMDIITSSKSVIGYWFSICANCDRKKNSWQELTDFHPPLFPADTSPLHTPKICVPSS